MRGRSWGTIIVVAIAVLVVASATAEAAAPATTIAGNIAKSQIQQIIAAYITATDRWYQILRRYAVDLFAVVAVIEFGWGGGRLVLAGGDLAEWAVFVVRSLATISFFSMVLEYYQMFGLYIVKGLAQAAGDATGVPGTSPGAVIAAGFNFLTELLQNLSRWTPVTDVSIIVAGVATLVVFALIAARMVLITIEAYFAINAGVLLVGLGPSSWGNEYAMNAIRWVLKVAVKIFILELVVGVGQSILLNFETSLNSPSGATIFVILASAIVLLALVKELPDMAASLFGGHVGSTGIGIGAAAAAMGGAAAGAIAGSAGGISAVSEASDLAAAAGGGGGGGGGGSTVSGQDDALLSGGSPPTPPPTRGQLMARTAGILGRAAMADIQGRREGDPASRGGNMAGRMARRIRSANPQKSDIPPLTPDP